MLIKVILLICLALMVFNLFKALWVMNKQNNHADKPISMSTFIGRRLIFSIFIVLLILFGMLTGIISPNPHP